MQAFNICMTKPLLGVAFELTLTILTIFRCFRAFTVSTEAKSQILKVNLVFFSNDLVHMVFILKICFT